MVRRGYASFTTCRFSRSLRSALALNWSCALSVRFATANRSNSDRIVGAATSKA